MYKRNKYCVQRQRSQSASSFQRAQLHVALSCLRAFSHRLSVRLSVDTHPQYDFWAAHTILSTFCFGNKILILNYKILILFTELLVFFASILSIFQILVPPLNFHAHLLPSGSTPTLLWVKKCATQTKHSSLELSRQLGWNAWKPCKPFAKMSRHPMRLFGTDHSGTCASACMKPEM